MMLNFRSGQLFCKRKYEAETGSFIIEYNERLVVMELNNMTGVLFWLS